MTTVIFCLYLQTDYSKPAKQEVDGTVILPPLVFPGTARARSFGTGLTSAKSQMLECFKLTANSIL